MSPVKKRDNTALLVGAAGLGALLLWSRQAGAAQAVDPRWLAQQELARRQAMGSPTAGTDTLGMILKLGGSAVALGSTVYGILAKVFASGSEKAATLAVTKLIQDGPTSLVPSSPVSTGTVEEIISSWEAVPPQVPGVPITDVPPTLDVIPPGTDVVQTVPLPEPPVSLPPTIEPTLIDFPTSLTLPGSIFDPSTLEGATGAALLQQDGLVRLSLTTEEMDQASNLVRLWKSGDLDLSLLPADKAAFMQENLPMLERFTESGDFGLGQFKSPVSGDTIMKAMPEGTPTEWTPGFSLDAILDTVVWETRTIDASGNVILQLTTLKDVLTVVGQVVAGVAAAVSIAFTIMGTLPDYQKALYCALDAASFAAIFIPVVGWIVAAVIQIVKFVLQKVLAQGKSHEQREAEETAVLLTKAQELGKELVQALTLRQLYDTLAAYSSGYVGGTRDICIAVGAYFPDGSWVPVGVHASNGSQVLTLSEFVEHVNELTVRIQGGVKPENLAAADAALKGMIQQIIPLMVNARAGDFDATSFLVNRALSFWLPTPNPMMRDARQILATISGGPATILVTEYPWWREITEQVAYTLQAVTWLHHSWISMVNNAITAMPLAAGTMSAAVVIDVASWDAKTLTAFAQHYGYKTFTDWRRAFFAFEEPISQSFLNGRFGVDKVYDMQKQIELLATAVLGAKVAVADYDDLANALHASPTYAAIIGSVYVPDYSISDAWTARLSPFQTIGMFRLPTTGQWEYYEGGAWHVTSFQDVVARVTAGAWQNIFHRNLYQALGMPDPNDPSRIVPNPVFLVPNIAPYF